MTELLLRADSKEAALAEGREMFDLDIDIVNGRAVTIDDPNKAEFQRAYLCVYTKKGTIPLQEEKGIPIVDFLNDKIFLNELNAQMQKRINELIGPMKYSTYYEYDGKMIRFSLTILNGNRG